MAKTKLRGSKVTQQVTSRRINQPARVKNKKLVSKSRPSLSFSAAPASLGAGIISNRMDMSYSSNGDSVRCRGQEVVITGSVAYTSSAWVLVGGHHLNPAYFLGSRLVYLSNLYEYFTFNRVSITFVPALGSNAVGDVVLTYVENPDEAIISPSGANFVTKALSKPGNILSSVWRTFTIDLDIQRELKYTSISSVPDPKENSLGDIFLYQYGQTVSVGYIVCSYDITFTRSLFLPRISNLAVSGDWTRNPLVVNAATPTVGDTVILTNMPVSAVGVVVRCYVTDVSMGAGTTTANAWRIQVGAQSVATTIVNGYSFYAIYATTTSAYIFPSYQAACAGDINLSTALLGHTITTATANTTDTLLNLFTLQLQQSDINMVVPA